MSRVGFQERGTVLRSSKSKATKKAEPPTKEATEPKEPAGPRFTVTANALHSKVYRGRVQLGTYSEKERQQGVVTKRIETLKVQGYEQIDVVEAAEE